MGRDTGQLTATARVDTTDRAVGKTAKTETISFSQDTAEKTHLSPRAIQQDIQIATKLDNKIRDALRDTPLADNKTELLKLARLEPEEQEKVVEKICHPHKKFALTRASC